MNRWTVIAILFLVRASMGIAYQSVPALTPLFERDLALTIADVGILIGLFHLPGIVLALPSGTLSAKIGEKPVVLAGLLLMAIGSAMMAMLPTWGAQLGGRLLAGIGGVLLNVAMTKMVTDWFAGKEIATAMAIFANAWPGGIAIAWLVLPPISLQSGLSGALIAASLYALAAAVFLALVYRRPSDYPQVAGRGERPRGATLSAVLTAGTIWGLYNLSFGMIFAFGPKLLVERGWTLVGSGQMGGSLMVLAVISVVVGGLLADRSGRADLVVTAGTLVLAALLALCAYRTETATLAMLALAAGLPAGAILSLPAQVLAPHTRAIGMGLFFTMFYVCVGIGPIIAGRLAAATGTTATTFLFGAALLLACPLLLRLFHAFKLRVTP